jgi:hypothetical protein
MGGAHGRGGVPRGRRKPGTDRPPDMSAVCGVFLGH